jgi:malonyl-CoA/methylmalonyl-CoA synthetase
MLGGFNLDKVCKEISQSDYTVFTAVPTIYFSLIEKLEETNDEEIFNGFKRLRLMMSGSAALAPEIHKKWEKLTSQKILERYGMTEVGMALSNKIDGERRPGAVGEPLPNVEIKLEDENGNEIKEEGEIGQILLKGPQVFMGYQNLPEKTQASFKDGWFLTGDVAIMEKGYYRLLGRDSIDIIKSGGYKISALEIEDVLLKHKNVKECAVVGKDDNKWGEIVVAAIIPKNKTISEEEVQNWCSKYVSNYKIPRMIKFLDGLPKNSMGKVTKKELKNIFS